MENSQTQFLADLEYEFRVSRYSDGICPAKLKRQPDI
jgi:hypothetical protein